MFGSRFCVALLLVLLVSGVGMTSLVRAQEQSEVCERALSTAEEQYLEGAFEEALRLVSACLNQGDRSAEQSVDAYRQLALIHLKRDELDRAREAIVNLLGVDPTYTADPITSPPSYVSLVSVVQRDLETRADSVATAESSETPFFRRTGTWVTVGTILVGGGVATFFALDGGGGGSGNGPGPPTSNPLPIPPGTP